MKKISSKLTRCSAGFTLAEVLIASLIAAFVITAGFQLFIDQSESHIVQQRITDMQQNGRATIDELCDRIRQAGYMLPTSEPALRSWNANPDTIAVAFLAEPVCTASLSAGMASATSEIRCEDSDLSCFEPNTWAYIHDAVTDSGEYFYVTSVDAATGRIQHGDPLSRSYPDNAQLYMIEYYKYYVDKSDTLHPMFMMEKNGSNPVVYSDNIENMQFTYVYPDGSKRDTISLARYIRKVEIEVMVQSEEKDLIYEELRRDTLRTTVEVRNLSL